MTRNWTRHGSGIDASVNFVKRTPDGGAFEARFVQRDPSYFIIYLSSQTGCDQACRFCHLTQMGQTMRGQARVRDYVEQAAQVIGHHDRTGAAPRKVHVNFMARGEPLLNPHLADGFDRLAGILGEMARTRDLEIRYNISSIFPRETSDLDLVTAFAGHPVTFYWSLYSLDPAFRRRWLPRSEDPQRTAERLRVWQEVTGREVVIHHALIAGENDGEDDMRVTRDFLVGSGLRTRLNLVRYNSFGARTGEEASDAAYARAMEILGDSSVATRARIVPRVGRDVAASCGMFLA